MEYGYSFNIRTVLRGCEWFLSRLGWRRRFCSCAVGCCCRCLAWPDRFVREIEWNGIVRPELDDDFSPRNLFFTDYLCLARHGTSRTVLIVVRWWAEFQRSGFPHKLSIVRLLFAHVFASCGVSLRVTMAMTSCERLSMSLLPLHDGAMEKMD